MQLTLAISGDNIIEKTSTLTLLSIIYYFFAKWPQCLKQKYLIENPPTAKSIIYSPICFQVSFPSDQEVGRTTVIQQLNFLCNILFEGSSHNLCYFVRVHWIFNLSGSTVFSSTEAELVNMGFFGCLFVFCIVKTINLLRGLMQHKQLPPIPAFHTRVYSTWNAM